MMEDSVRSYLVGFWKHLTPHEDHEKALKEWVRFTESKFGSRLKDDKYGFEVTMMSVDGSIRLSALLPGDSPYLKKLTKSDSK